MNAARKLFLLFVIPVVLARASDPDGDRIFSATELASLDRENEMWRTLRVEDDVDGCVRRLLDKGFPVEEVVRIRSQIETIWAVELDRNFGWLSQEAVEKIETVDRKFIPRLRAVRLHENKGIQTQGAKVEKRVELNREWQRAIQHELDFREITEFRLMNSASAQEVTKRVAGMKLTTDERRVLCTWQRDFDGAHRTDNRFPGRKERLVHLEDGLDFYREIRSLLGDDRFAIYLTRAETEFERMNGDLASLGHVSAGMAIDLWWMKQKKEVALGHAIEPAEWKRINAVTRQSAELLLGEARFVHYLADENAAWLNY